MSFLNMFDKLDDIIYKPIEAITDWAKEPLKQWEHKRDLEKQTALLNAESENKIKENESRVNLAIKKETEIKRILAEIEEYKKDKEFERMKAVSEAIMKYQQELTKLNVNAINAIGHMQLDLREKAQALVYDKTIKYKELQDSAFREAAEDLKRIENDFSGNEIAKEILVKAVDKRLANIIDTAHNFLLELNADMKLLNQNISILADKGQIFIEHHLDKFHMIESTAKEIKRIEGK